MGQGDLFAVGFGAYCHQRRRITAPREIATGLPFSGVLGCAGQDRKGAIKRYWTTRAKRHLAQVLGANPLDRVAPDLGEGWHYLDSDFGVFLKPDLMLPSRTGVYPCERMIRYCCENVIVLFAIQ